MWALPYDRYYTLSSYLSYHEILWIKARRSVTKQIVWLARVFLVKLVVGFAYNKTYSEEMALFYDQFLRGVLFFAVGGVSSVAIVKIWENRESLLREIRRRFDSNENRQPEEHDERFDWEGRRYNNENIFLCVWKLCQVYWFFFLKTSSNPRNSNMGNVQTAKIIVYFSLKSKRRICFYDQIN